MSTSSRSSSTAANGSPAPAAQAGSGARIVAGLRPARSTGSSRTPLEVDRGPVERRGAVVAERAHPARTSLTILRDVMRPARVLSDLVLRQPARRAWRDAELGVAERADLVRVGGDGDRARRPRPRAARARRAGRAGRAGELISRAVPVSTARATTRSTSTSRRRARLLIRRPVRWPMQSTCGFSIAASTRSVGLRSSDVCSDATTQSSSRAPRRPGRARRRRGCSPRPRAARGTASAARSSASISSACASSRPSRR